MSISWILAALPRDEGAVAVRDGARTLVAVAPEELVVRSGAGAWSSLRTLAPGWWAGFLSYDLGRGVERVQPRAADDLEIPDLVLARFGARLVLGEGSPRIEGDGAGRHLLEEAVRLEARPPHAVPLRHWTSSLDRTAYEERVRAALAHIVDGECYQVNVTRRLLCEREADPIALNAEIERRNPSPHGAFVRLGGLAVVSASPELFLRLGNGRVETKPIKGTGTEPAALEASAKDRAENVMITDLARNDLGRVCRPGTIRVPALCAVEHHPGLYHLVSTVRGEPRRDISVADLIHATFPPASITGAPKPRVMQIIEDLEPVRRGVYCGAIGWIDTERGALDLNVAIRTFVVARGTTSLGAGGGIVADSTPAAEWRETELKAARLLEAAGLGTAVPALR